MKRWLSSRTGFPRWVHWASMAWPGAGLDGGEDAAENHLRSIFDLCDEDGDGLVAVADLRRREEMLGYDKVRFWWPSAG